MSDFWKVIRVCDVPTCDVTEIRELTDTSGGRAVLPIPRAGKENKGGDLDLCDGCVRTVCESYGIDPKDVIVPETPT